MPPLPALTSLRFFAALLVFVSHLDFLKATPDVRIQDFFSNVLYQGYIGVTFFFVLSGFILSYAHQNRPIGKANYSDFLFSRIARIYPLHLLTLAAVIVPFWYLAPAETTLSEYLRPLPYNATLIQALSSSGKKFFSFNAPSWSLSAEMFFYVLFPLFVALRTRVLLALAATIVVVKMLLVHWLPASSMHYAMYISPPLRLADFVVGILLLRLYNRHAVISDQDATRLQWLSVALMGVLAATWPFVPQAHRFDLYALGPMAFLVLAFAYQNGALAKALSKRPLILLGEASFAFYMVHQIFIRLGEAYRPAFGIEPGVAQDAAFILGYFLLSLSVSLLLFRYFEAPAKRLTLRGLYKARAFIRRGRSVGEATN